MTPEQIRQLPKTELHLHLEGTMRHETFLTLSQKNKRPVPPALVRQFPDTYRTFSDFVATYYAVCNAIAAVTDFESLIADVIAYVREQNIRYSEISWTPFFYLEKGMNFSKIMGIFNEATERTGLRDSIYFIIDVQRDHGSIAAKQVFTEVFASRDFNIAGIGLTGDETRFPSEPFEFFFKNAKYEHGLGCTAHAGEYGPPSVISTCIKVLEADRIGHGIRAIEDEQVLQLALSRNVHFEICPTSNVKLNRVESFAKHPLKQFLEKGINAGLNADDPGIFRSGLSNEYQLVQKHLELSDDKILALLRHSAKAAFTTPERKEKLVREIEAAF